MDVICCKSVGTDLSMLDIEDFITEICQLKKEVASLEAKLRERGDNPNREVRAAHHFILQLNQTKVLLASHFLCLSNEANINWLLFICVDL